METINKEKTNTIVLTAIKFITALAVFEDLLRRLFSFIPAEVLILKSFLLFLLFLVLKKIIKLHKISLPFTRWLMLLSLIIIPYLYDINGIIISGIWLNAIVIMPFLLYYVLSRLSLKELLIFYRYLAFLAFVAAVFGIFNYFTDLYQEFSTFGIPSKGGFRIFEGDRLYFNAGWFMGSERLAWFNAIGLGLGFLLLNENKKNSKSWIYFLVIALAILSSYSTGRVTGILISIFMFIIMFYKSFFFKLSFSFYSIIIFFFVLINVESFISSTSDTRMLFIFEHSSTVESRGLFHLSNIMAAIEFAKLFGYGPIPQGISYALSSYSLPVNYWFEGLISHSITQFGILSVVHLVFNFWLIYIAILAIRKYNNYLFYLGVLMLAMKIWIIKASQMETDLFAQFTFYLIATPVIKQFLIDKFSAKQ